MCDQNRAKAVLRQIMSVEAEQNKLRAKWHELNTQWQQILAEKPSLKPRRTRRVLIKYAGMQRVLVALPKDGKVRRWQAIAKLVPEYKKSTVLTYLGLLVKNGYVTRPSVGHYGAAAAVE
jgi:hypothetical protein